jgi:hypothetical protein
MRDLRFVGAALAAVLLAARPAPAVDRDAVNAAIDTGVRYLQGHQLGNGTWAHEQIGLTALAGLTLLECGVPVDDPGIQKAAAAVREASVHADQTYSISLAILFLDRLGEPVDVALIESLTVRLLGGQGAKGGWEYKCPHISTDEQRRLTTLVKQRAQHGPDKNVTKPEPGRRTVEDLPKEIRGQLENVRRHQAGHPALSTGMPPDNSNTQFATIALWVARRYGLPVDGALREIEHRFRSSPNLDGGWSYVPMAPGMDPAMMGSMGSTPAMTCAGLLGVGVAYGAWNDAALRTDPRGRDSSRPGAPPTKAQDPSKDKVVVDAFRLLGRWVDAMAAPQADGKPPRVNTANGKFYYFLWSLERMAVAYNVDTVGKTDWYDWGTGVLLANQGRGGGWNNGEFRMADTCFALLVLKRANLAPDLSSALKSQMKDGLQASLRQGGTSGAELVKGRKPFFGGPVAEDRTKPDNSADAEAAKLAKQLPTAEGEAQDQLLKQLREGKGAAYTDALAAAIPRLDGEARKKAREALADRLSHMTSETLGVKLSDDDPEVRRAAAIAVAMKEDKTHAYRLIELLSDDEVTVARAAYAALKSLSGEDFGPTKDATRSERAQAILAWKAWWAKQQEKK